MQKLPYLKVNRETIFEDLSISKLYKNNVEAICQIKQFQHLLWSIKQK